MLKPSMFACRACPLNETRRNICDGAGRPDAPLLIIGEAPGKAEDQTGMPFAGQSGKLLRATLAEAGILDGNYFLTNVVKCRPPENRDPTAQEIQACSGWLTEEMTHASPRLILTLGKYAQASIRDLQQHGIVDPEVQIVEAQHPAFTMRAPRARKAWATSIESVGRSLGTLPAFARDSSPGTGNLAPPQSLPYQFGLPDYRAEYYAADTETDDLEEDHGVRTVGYSVSDGSRAGFRGGTYLGGTGDYADLRVLAGRMDAGLVTYLHNAKYDAAPLGIDLRREDAWECTMLMAYVLRYERVGLKLLAPQVAGFDLEPISAIIGTGKKRIPFSQALRANYRRASTYACGDAVATSRVAAKLLPEIQAIPRLETYYRQIEKPAVRVIRDMEQRGALVDPAHLQTLATEFEREIATRTETQALSFHGTPPKFNRASNQQLARQLLSEGLVLRDKTPTGQWKLDDAILERLEARYAHPAVTQERAIRKLTKLKTTYADRLLRDMDSTHRVHARINQAVTNTSRLSSSDPNLQNIPIRTEQGKRIRKAFIARPGYTFLKADASQLEVRVYAEYTGEPVLVDAYTHTVHDTSGRKGGCLRCDVHQQVAFELLISRDDAKNTLFAAIYGAEEDRLAATAHVAVENTGAFLTRMRERVPSLLTYRKDIAGILFQQGWVETLQGFRSYFPLYASVLPSEKAAALREAGNLPIQGTGAGIIKQAMTQADALASRYEAELVLTVHDEVDYEVPDANVVPFGRELQILFRDVAALYLKRVPFRLDIATGPNWADLEDLPYAA